MGVPVGKLKPSASFAFLFLCDIVYHACHLGACLRGVSEPAQGPC